MTLANVCSISLRPDTAGVRSQRQYLVLSLYGDIIEKTLHALLEHVCDVCRTEHFDDLEGCCMTWQGPGAPAVPEKKV